MWHEPLEPRIPTASALGVCQKTLVVNVGSIGYPRNQDKSIYAIFDTDEQKICFRSLPFDMAGYVQSLKKNNIEVPHWIPSF